jgi:hypothetical protein
MMRSLELFAREVYPAIRELGESHQHVEAAATVGGCVLSSGYTPMTRNHDCARR